jgi:hypothetical protein
MIGVRIPHVTMQTLRNIREVAKVASTTIDHTLTIRLEERTIISGLNNRKLFSM